MMRLLAFLFMVCLWGSCESKVESAFVPLEAIPEPVPYVLEVLIPADTTKSDNKLLRRVNHVLFLAEDLYSGYLLESYPDGAKKKLMAYHRGLAEGPSIRWYNTGELESERQYSKGQKAGRHNGYYADGSDKFVYEFWQGEYHGKYQEWFVDGTPSKIGYYREGQEVGVHKMWDNKGKIRANYAIREGRRYGLTGAKPCYSKVHK